MSVKWNTGHYVETPREDQLEWLQNNPEILTDPNIEGVKLKIYWSDIETAEGQYDFSEIDAILEELEKYDKHLVVQVMDRSFHEDIESGDVIPEYIIDAGDEYWSDLSGGRDGGAAAMWEPWVVDQYIDLMEALAERYDDHPNFEGVSLTETALGVEDDYDKDQYKEQYIRLFEETAQAFDNSIVLANLNYLSGNGKSSEENLMDIAEVVAQYDNGGITTPDSVPSRPSPFNDVAESVQGDVLIAPSAQASFIDLEDDNPEAINDLNVNELGANYLFWAHWHKDDSDYVENQVIPGLEEFGDEIQENPIPDNIEVAGSGTPSTPPPEPQPQPEPQPTPDPDPAPPSTPTPEPDATHIEAESMNLSGEYKVEANGDASGNKAISLRGGKTEGQGEASFTFDGPSGEYDITIAYFDENDGEGTIELSQSGETVAEITLDQQLGSTSPNAQTLTSAEIQNVSVQSGDTFNLKGFEDGDSSDAEHVRIDYIEFAPVEASSPSPQPDPEPQPNPEPSPQPAPNPSQEATRIEAESMELSGEYKVESNSVASGDSAISLRGGKTEGQGEASFTFDGPSGDYDIKIAYFDENDGEGSIELSQNNQPVADLSLDQQLGSTSPNAQTLTSAEIQNVSVQSGDTFTLTGFEDGNHSDAEHVRIDYVEFIPKTGTDTIAFEPAEGSNATVTPTNGQGLQATYYSDSNLSAPVIERTDATIDFFWGNSSPDASLEADTFSVRWTGYIAPEYSETYEFQTLSDDGVRLWVDDELIIDDWNQHAAKTQTGSIDLEAGQLYPITLEYYENQGDAVSQLSWASSSQELEVVPQSQLFTPNQVDSNGVVVI